MPPQRNTTKEQHKRRHFSARCNTKRHSRHTTVQHIDTCTRHSTQNTTQHKYRTLTSWQEKRIQKTTLLNTVQHKTPSWTQHCTTHIDTSTLNTRQHKSTPHHADIMAREKNDIKNDITQHGATQNILDTTLYNTTTQFNAPLPP